MVEGAALEMLCAEMHLGFESLTLRQRKEVEAKPRLLLFYARDSNSEGSEAKPKPNTPGERLPSRNERSEAIKIPNSPPINQSALLGGLIFSLREGFEA